MANLIQQYKEYVNWCKAANTYPIGFVNWKEQKFNKQITKIRSDNATK